MVREVDGELVLLDARTDRIHRLNQTASFIWRACDGVTPSTAIAQALANEFDVEHDKALADVLDTTSALQALSLLEQVK